MATLRLGRVQDFPLVPAAGGSLSCLLAIALQVDEALLFLCFRRRGMFPVLTVSLGEGSGLKLLPGGTAWSPAQALGGCSKHGRRQKAGSW